MALEKAKGSLPPFKRKTCTERRARKTSTFAHYQRARHCQHPLQEKVARSLAKAMATRLYANEKSSNVTRRNEKKMLDSSWNPCTELTIGNMHIWKTAFLALASSSADGQVWGCDSNVSRIPFSNTSTRFSTRSRCRFMSLTSENNAQHFKDENQSCLIYAPVCPPEWAY